MPRTVADLLVETLAAAGVKRIYGIVGDSLNPVTDAVRRDGHIQWVHVRHEEAGAFAASAEAQLRGELVVCAGTLQPGDPAPPQRLVRLPAQSRARAGHRLAHPQQRDRHGQLPGDASEPFVTSGAFQNTLLACWAAAKACHRYVAEHEVRLRAYIPCLPGMRHAVSSCMRHPAS